MSKDSLITIRTYVLQGCQINWKLIMWLVHVGTWALALLIIQVKMSLKMTFWLVRVGAYSCIMPFTILQGWFNKDMFCIVITNESSSNYENVIGREEKENVLTDSTSWKRKMFQVWSLSHQISNKLPNW